MKKKPNYGYIHKDTPNKPFPYVEVVLSTLFIILVLVALESLNIIHLTPLLKNKYK